MNLSLFPTYKIGHLINVIGIISLIPAQLPKWLSAAMSSWHTIHPEYKKVPELLLRHCHSDTFIDKANN